MRRAIDRRLAAAEQEIISKAPVFRIIRVRGGLPGPVRCARVDSLHWRRLPEESTEVFEKRVIEGAKSADSKTVIFAGLCPCAWQEPGAFGSYLRGPDFRQFDDDGIVIERQEDR